MDIPGLLVESYIYALDNKTPFGELLDELKHITKRQYKAKIKPLFGDKWDTNKKLIDQAVDVWFDTFERNPLKIPFAFDEKGNIKLRRDVADKLGYNDKSKIKGITIGNGSLKIGKYISTRDQELATCILWNRIVRFNSKDKLNDLEEIRKAVAEDSGIDKTGKTIDLDDSWCNSCALQISAIKKYITSQGWDWREYCASRYDDKSDKNSGPAGREYAQFVRNYIATCESEYKVGISKDTYDPSDIILVRRGAVENWEDKAGDALSYVQALIKKTAGKPYTEMHDIYRETFKKGDIIGISLKKINESPRYDVFNIGADKATVKVTSVNFEGFSHERGSENITGCSYGCPGDYKFSETSDPESKDPTEGIKENVMYVTCRSFSGKKDLDIDIKAEAGPALGKVPRDLWRSLLDVDNTFSEDNIKLIASKLSDEETMTKLIQGGIKNGPWCLPFVLVH